uniref:Ribonuclease S-2 n=1 Tax=Antirrhinum hispanicum TaxID=49039 RepID=RNS2_ANTHI|nr:RecName: Full=Ribonuclease S-2; AltName: Full=S2-RNase; AltName: Full=Stylar glycoprotein 2; Flags: Precursor [Antirrhinum hispanicum]CAA65319.1 S2-RNase [Antirrhinum hispanicum]
MATVQKSQHSHFFLLVGCIVHLSNFCSTTTAQFDYFKLVLQWPNSYCSLKTTHCPRTRLPSQFTIHGLWPDNKSWPLSNCRDTSADVLKITDKGLIQDLAVHWPDLTRRQRKVPGQKFWVTQWKKHGACALPMYSFNDYFVKALELKKRNNVLDMLSRKSLTPGDQRVDVSDVNGAITKVTGGIAILKCPEGYLTEVIICFDPSGFPVIDCPGPFPCKDDPLEFQVLSRRKFQDL